jgi:hypothetical protein
MRITKQLILGSVISLIASTSAFAQARQVSLKPVLKPGQESRYSFNISVDTRVTPTGDQGLASVIHKETTTTVLLRGVASEKSEASYEAEIETFTSRTTLDGADVPDGLASPVGAKIEYSLDSLGRPTNVKFPMPAWKSGLTELLLSLARWVPSNEVSVGLTWGQSIAIDSLEGDYGYISSPSLAEIPKRAAVSYKLSSLDGDRAVIEGAITLNQNGSCSLTTKQGRLNVTTIAEGKGSTRVDYDVSAGQVIAATTETSFEGRLMNMAPTRAGEKHQPREGTVTETAKFSIKLVQ